MGHATADRSVLAGGERGTGPRHDVVEWTYEQAYEMPEHAIVFTTRLFLDSARHIRRVVTPGRPPRMREDHQVVALALDEPLSASVFTWTPPAGVTIQSGTIP